MESRVFGVLVAARKERDSFSSGECEFLRQLSEHVALAAHQAQLHGALQQAYEDLRQTQQAVMQQERLRALGQMASGIAHDINNALSPVSLYTQSLLEREPGLSARTRDYLETIQRAVEDVAHTVARMREFYRQREPQLTLMPVHLNQLVQQVVDLTRARWSDMPQLRGTVIALRTELAEQLPAISGIESEIREALINLIFNAVDAVPGGGTLTLRTKLAGGADGHGQVRIEVGDDGVGMDEETRRRCLEPFFTTKGERGTGLGLAMVYGVLRRHNGEIEIDSAVGRGTTVSLNFPVPQAAPATPSQDRLDSARLSRLRLLLVDDDPLLLKSLCNTLEAEGHVVTTANDGVAGIAAFRAASARGETFAAVITDLGMPDVDGRKVASAIKAASPATPVIMLTGWGKRLMSEDDIPAHVDHLLSKPPKLRELRETLAQCCEPGRAQGAIEVSE
ncbi:response regulator [Bradyrhizobium diazoefficiens]